MSNDPVVMTVAGVALDDGSGSPAVLLRDRGGALFLSVPVGPSEAGAVIMEVEGLHPPRPLTHDLIATLFSRHRFRLEGFDLYGRDGLGFVGRLRYRAGWRRFSMEVRPADGIALALKMGAPIAADRTLAFEAAPASFGVPRPFFSEDYLSLDRSVAAEA